MAQKGFMQSAKWAVTVKLHFIPSIFKLSSLSNRHSIMLNCFKKKKKRKKERKTKNKSNWHLSKNDMPGSEAGRDMSLALSATGMGISEPTTELPRAGIHRHSPGECQGATSRKGSETPEDDVS